MKPILYTAEENQFTSHGLGDLVDAISCTVEEERNGPYELTLEYPIDGAHFSDIQERRIILAKPNPHDQAQPFRIYKIGKPLNGRCIIHAQHLSYDLSGVPIRGGWTASTVGTTFGQMAAHAMTPCPFTFSTDKGNTATFNLKQPRSARAILGGTEGSILDVFGTGEYKFDRYSVYLYLHRGQDRGVAVRYGKNLVDLLQEEEISNCYSGVYGFYSYDNNGETVTVECSSVRPTGLTLAVPRVLTLDLSEVVELTNPTQADVDAATDDYINAHDMTTPAVNLTVDFVQLSGASWYDEEIAHLERVELCDTVKVLFEKLGVNASAKVIKTEYDVLMDRYKTIELGDPKTTLADTILNNGQTIKELQKSEVTTTVLATAIARATELISGMVDGHLIIWNNQTQEPENPNELIITEYSVDDPDHDWLNEGHIWRWNLAGWGHSSSGYNGTYALAATLDGGMLADFITAGTMLANRIRGGELDLGGLNNADGIFRMFDAADTQIGKWDKDGIEVKKGSIDIGGTTYDSKTQLRITATHSLLGLFESYVAPNGFQTVNTRNGVKLDTFMGGDGVRCSYGNTTQSEMGAGPSNSYFRAYGPNFAYSSYMEDKNTYVYGNCSVGSLTNRSKEELKKNIKPLSKSLDKVKLADICTYDLKAEKNGNKHIGMVLGDKYNVPKEIIGYSDDGKPEGIDIYSMCSMLWKAVQELSAEVEELKNGGTKK